MDLADIHLINIRIIQTKIIIVNGISIGDLLSSHKHSKPHYICDDKWSQTLNTGRHPTQPLYIKL